MAEEGASIIALLDGPDRPGLVARTAGWIYERGGNILSADQHRDDDEGVFFQRIEWMPAGSPAIERAAFERFSEELGMRARTTDSSRRPPVAIFVSAHAHCFLDLLARWQIGEFRGEIACVVSNHEEMRRASEFHGIPFYCLPVSDAARRDAESRQLRLVVEHGIELIVLARYMQILSKRFLGECGCPVINIHHSFLPAFAGARPYHQAHARGVKLIGATAHYATPILDEGPIIQQDTIRVNHRHGVADLVRKGRDLEKSVLAQAVSWHLEHRILACGNKTVVFD